MTTVKHDLQVAKYGGVANSLSRTSYEQLRCVQNMVSKIIRESQALPLHEPARVACCWVLALQCCESPAAVQPVDPFAYPAAVQPLWVVVHDSSQTSSNWKAHPCRAYTWLVPYKDPYTAVNFIRCAALRRSHSLTK